jgi:hypothetical protein
MLCNRQIPALYNGISQQPATLRMPSQSEVQINAWSTVVEGLRERPPTQHVAKITSGDLGTAYLHTINRDTTERYHVVITNGDLKVYTLGGVERTVNFPNGKAYLTVVDAKTEYSATTVADYTFIVNKTVTVQMKAVAADQTAQPTNYYWLNNKLTGAQAGAFPSLAAVQAQYGVNVTGGTFQGVKQTFDDLPKAGGAGAPSQGDIWQIQGDANSSFTSYYVIRDGGVWNETVKPGIKNLIDATTMPWALVRKADGSFDFAPFSWAPRRVGDETTNPNPSFVGRTLRDVYFAQNRLGFTCDENGIMSAGGDFGNYYRLTVVQLLPASVVDIGASETSVTKLNFAVPFATGLMFFSDQTQFRLLTPQDVGIGPTTVSLEVATRYVASTTVRPIMVGSDAYFPSEDADFAKVREYFIKMSYLGQIQTDAADITAHVPKYIPAGVYLLEGSLNQDALFLATEDFPNRLYVYKFYWTDETNKAQSAWSYWDFGTGNAVLAASCLDDFVYFLIRRSDGTYLEKMTLALGANAGLTDVSGKSYDILLDRRAAVTGNWLSAQDITVYVFPYNVDTASVRLVQTSGPTPGAMFDPSTYTFTAANTVAVPGNHPGTALGGNFYEFRYTFSEQFMLNRQGVAVLSGKLTLRNWTVSFTDTAFFSIEVNPYGVGDPNILSFVPSQESAYSGMTIGEAAMILGSPVFRNGSFTFGVFGDAKLATVTLTNNTPYPVNFVEAEWEGDYTNRSQTL